MIPSPEVPCRLGLREAHQIPRYETIKLAGKMFPSVKSIVDCAEHKQANIGVLQDFYLLGQGYRPVSSMTQERFKCGQDAVIYDAESDSGGNESGSGCPLLHLANIVAYIDNEDYREKEVFFI